MKELNGKIVDADALAGIDEKGQATRFANAIDISLEAAAAAISEDGGRLSLSAVLGALISAQGMFIAMHCNDRNARRKLIALIAKELPGAVQTHLSIGASGVVVEERQGRVVN